MFDWISLLVEISDWKVYKQNTEIVNNPLDFNTIFHYPAVHIQWGFEIQNLWNLLNQVLFKKSEIQTLKSIVSDVR